MNKIIDINNLSISIGERRLVEDISFSISQGDVILLSGANGIGKSTILKSILRLESNGKKITGQIIDSEVGDILNLNDDEVQKYRSQIAYIQQKDEYAEMGNIRVADIISECSEAYSGKTLSDSEVNGLIDKWIPRRENNSRIFEAKSKPCKFSGGEQRLLSVFSVIATRPNAKLLIIDEPLNNLDFVNARNISNLINRVIKDNPNMGVIMVSHCRIFPFITKEIKLSVNGVQEITEDYICHSCFGEPNKEGFYL